ncbi:MAG: hypothetical protein WCG93_16640 [Paludibacter sp.]
MTNYDVKRLALVLAVQADIEGMKVENLQREQQGMSPAYPNELFQDMAEQLRNLAALHDEQL